jgi:hypothetical protein
VTLSVEKVPENASSDKARQRLADREKAEIEARDNADQANVY